MSTTPSTSGPSEAPNSHRNDSGATIGNWSPHRVAALAAAAGLLSAVPAMPSAVSAVLLLAFVLLGPGNIVVPLLGEVDAATRRALVPVSGVSAMIIVAAASVALHFYSPRLMFLVVALVVLLAAVHGLARSTGPTARLSTDGAS